jgi:NADP-dependent 3-hydroxy acid dehydrogenase YdfG
MVTGAGAGIGRAIAKAFARRGWLVGAYDINHDAVVETAEEIGTATVLAGHLDVAEPAAWKEALARFTADTGGRLDVLVNNAGIISGGRFEDIPLDAHRQIVRVNIDGVLIGCHAAFPYLLRTPGSAVINVASASALYGQPELASYSASKFAVRAITEALNIEWRQHDIRVVDILPPFVQTAMAAEFAHLGSARSMGVTVTPEHVGEVVLTVAERRGRAALPHVFVDGRTRLAALAVRLFPARATRWLVRRVSRA